MKFTDFILPFQTDKTGLRGRFVKLSQVIETIIKQHAYPEPVAYILAQMATLAAALSDLLKFHGIFTLQTKSDGPISMVVIDVTSAGAMRGFARYDEERLTQVETYIDQPIPALLGQGYMAFTIDQGAHTDLYQAMTELKGTTLGACASHYFMQSEQIDTLIHLVTDHQSGGWQSAFLMLQKMPPPSMALEDEQRPIRIIAEETQEGWDRAKFYFETIKPDEMFSLDPDNLLYRLFHEDGVRVYPAKELSFGCRCDRGRLGEFLAQLSASERKELAKDKVITVTCDFCNQSYDYKVEDFG